MTIEQIKLVKESWAKVEPISEVGAELFYGRLFQLDPTLKPMFKSDIKEQGKKLMTMIGVAVKGLNNLEGIVGAVQEMGRRHAGYGVKDEHYDTVAAALLWTLSKALADAYTKDVEAAWVATYTLLATTMKEAAKDATAEVPSAGG